MRPGRTIAVGIAIFAAIVLAWNASRFVGTKPQPRMKDLDFLPPPVVAQALALGQPTALAKLRWIDSFAYFQLQLSRQDDRIRGDDGRGGFERLYDTLIALDPLFLPFYEHAVLNTGGVLKRHQAALGFVMRGLLQLPHQTSLWRLASAELAVNAGWAARNPVALDQWLRSWAEAETTDEGRQLVLDWRRGQAFAAVEGIGTITYWLEQMRAAKAGTPAGDFAEGMVRELLAEYGARQLTGLQRAAASPTDFERRFLAAEFYPFNRSIRLDPQAVAGRWPQGPPPWAPIIWDRGVPTLRPDPFGYPWITRSGKVISVGLAQRTFVKTTAQRLAVESEANRRGRNPQDAAEAAEWGCPLPEPPFGGRWTFEGRLPEVAWPAPPHPPWRLR